ncbi:MAG: DUF1002 domain-containing protein [Oscillospiraceae bacterium]|nr:DUF1002 domain-containing protein [Oscillospiraceae bacterium]
MKRNRILSALLCLTLALGVLLPAVTARAAEDSCTVIGADLTDAERETVYALFGIDRGSVTELTMTNELERSYLEGSVDDSMLGGRSISCVYVRLAEPGSGVTLTLHNIDWCTEEMYRAAMTTAGVTDVDVVIAAPFSVSGTGAMAGIYLAYEKLTGESVDVTSRDLGGQELSVTADLADQVGEEGTVSIITSLKQMLSETRAMSDDELKDAIRSLAAGYNVNLTDYQVDQLFKLCRQLEKLTDSQLSERFDSLRETAKQLGDLNEKAQEARETAGTVLEWLKGLYRKAADFISGLLD